MKKTISILFVISIALTLTSCSAKNDSEVNGKLHILHFGNSTEPEAIDPHLVSGVPEHRITTALFEGLVDLDPETLEIRPAVAESWDVSENKTLYTFKLRENARWSNGDPLTAHDFIYAWQRNLSPDLASEYAYMLHCIKNAKDFNEGKLDDFEKVGVRAIDAHTLEVNLENPTPYFLSMQIHYSWFPVHRGTIEKFGTMTQRNSKWTRAGNFVGNGAFALSEWVPNRTLVVKKNEYYWNASAVKLDGIHFHPIDDNLTVERSFRSGKLHYADGFPMTKIPVYKKENPDAINIEPYLATYFYRFNVTSPPFNDARIRRAFAMAIDRKAIVEKVLGGGQLPAHYLTPPDTTGYTCEHSIEYDIEEAKRLLAEAGYPNGEGLPKSELLYNTSENHKLIAEAIQQMWKKNLGVEVSLVNQDWKVFLSSQKNLNYQISRSSWVGDIIDPINFLECYTTDNGNNRTGYSSKEYDELISMARKEPDTNKRNNLFQEAEQILMNDAPIIPIYFYTQVYLKDPKLQGWHTNQLAYISFKSLYFEENF